MASHILSFVEEISGIIHQGRMRGVGSVEAIKVLAGVQISASKRPSSG